MTDRISFKPTSKKRAPIIKNTSGGPKRPTLEHTLAELKDCTDVIHRTFPHIQTHIVYFPTMTDPNLLMDDVIIPLTHVNEQDVDNLLMQSQFVETTDPKKCIIDILSGHVAIFRGEQTYTVYAFGPQSRQVQTSEMETVITGPHDAFVEDAEKNISLIRRRLKSSHLKAIRIGVGEITKTNVFVLYLQDIANPDIVQKFIDRIKGIETDSVLDNNMLVQMIDENPNSVFPQYMTTERPDAAVSKLLGGKVIAVSDGSPSAICGPTSFFEFFASPEDYYQRWALGTGLRLLRLIAFIITLTFTAFYVSITTFHYEMVPKDLLVSLAESRNKVPFPPLMEALLMEITIELLREAGARLPTKIGQTIGIVGGIVIGSAAVEAGLYSNILIIVVASSAIASFVIPSYTMSASIRLLRFGLIFAAGMWGNIGLILGLGAIIIHLSGVTNLGTSYLTPIAPMTFSDWKDTFLRAPLWSLNNRSSQSKAVNHERNKMKR